MCLSFTLGSGLIGTRFCCRHAAPVAVGLGGHETKTSTAQGGAAGKEAREVPGATAFPGHEMRMVGGMGLNLNICIAFKWTSNLPLLE